MSVHVSGGTLPTKRALLGDLTNLSSRKSGFLKDKGNPNGWVALVGVGEMGVLGRLLSDVPKRIANIPWGRVDFENAASGSDPPVSAMDPSTWFCRSPRTRLPPDINTFKQHGCKGYPGHCNLASF